MSFNWTGLYYGAAPRLESVSCRNLSCTAQFKLRSATVRDVRTSAFGDDFKQRLRYRHSGYIKLMKARSLVRWFFTLCVAVLSMGGAASAADIHVMISAGFYGVYSELGPAFERATGHHLITTRGPSLGDSP